MPLLYATNTFSSLNFTSTGAVVFTHTMAANGRVGVSLVMTGFHGGAATITMRVATLDGSDNVYGSVVETTAKVTGETRLRFELDPPVFLPSGYKVRVSMTSTGSNNTSISGSWYVFDPNHASDVAALSSGALDSIIDGVWDESWLDHYGTTDSVAELMYLSTLFANEASANSTDILEDTSTTGVLLASAHDVYHADIDLAVDFEDTKDEYTIAWFKNGVRLTGSGSSSSPNLQVVKRDGTNLLSDTPDAIGETGSYKYTEETARLTPGVPVIVVASATIDSATRSFAKLVSRDKPVYGLPQK